MIEPIEQILEVRMTGAPEEVLEGVIDKAKWNLTELPYRTFITQFQTTI